MKTRNLFTGLFLFTILSFSLSSQTADEVINKYTKAVGGYDNIKNVKTLILTGKVSVHGFDLGLTVTFKRPNMVRFEVKMEDVTQLQVYDGKMGWATDFMTGGREAKKTSAETEEDLKYAADFEGAIIDYKKKGYSAWLAGKENVDSVETYKIGLSKTSGDTSYYYIDSKNYLIIKRSKNKHSNGMMVNTFIKGYIDAGNIKMPEILEVVTGESENKQVIKFDSAQVNTTIDDSIFKMPENK